jgi:hypothetical protein
VEEGAEGERAEETEDEPEYRTAGWWDGLKRALGTSTGPAREVWSAAGEHTLRAAILAETIRVESGAPESAYASILAEVVRSAASVSSKQASLGRMATLATLLEKLGPEVISLIEAED